MKSIHYFMLAMLCYSAGQAALAMNMNGIAFYTAPLAFVLIVLSAKRK